MHENREGPWTSWLPQQDRSAKAINRTADMDVQEQSDCVVVPMNQPNKEGQPSAEVGEGRAQSMAYVIAEPCIGVKNTACVDACPVDCIHPKKDKASFEEAAQLYIDPVECIDCGACVPVCPVSAIFALDDLPEKWVKFAQINADHFVRDAK